MQYRSAVALSTLLALLLLLSLAIVPVSEPTWEQQVAAVRNDESDTIHVAQEPVTDEQLGELNGLPALRVLKLEQGSVTANGLAVLAELPELDTLWLRNSQVGNRAIR